MSDPTRSRINAAFDDELASAPPPPGLRPLAVRAAIMAPPRRTPRPQVFALVAAILTVAIVATLVIGSHALRSTAPVHPTGSTLPPPGRAGAMVAYDEVHGQMVVFGGQNPALNETWTFDGRYWTHHHPALSPSPRFGGAMSYDASHNDVVLFGGLQKVAGKGGVGPVDDTWIWNGSTWREMHPAHEPALTFEAGLGLAFDPVSRTVLLHGVTPAGSETVGLGSAETWSWDGSDWTRLPSAGGPTGYATLAGGRQLLLLAGSAGSVGGRFVTETWAWSGSSWSRLHPPVDLPTMAFPSTAYDPSRGQLIVLSNDTWTWNGSAWSRQHPTAQPPVGYVVYMAALHEVISWGNVYGNADSDLWAWNGSDWRLIVPPGAKVEPNLVTPGNGKGGYTVKTTPDQVGATVRGLVTNSHPVLLPASPPAWAVDAIVFAGADAFTVRYQSDLRDRTVDLGIVVPNPAPGGPGSSDTRVKFRHALPLKYGDPGYAEYFVYDPTSPTSSRWLIWLEPGSTSVGGSTSSGVPYYLGTSGLTDAEFWQVANSLQ